MPNEGSSSAGTRPKKRRSWPRYSLRMLMTLMLMCALFFGYVGITLKRHKGERYKVDRVVVWFILGKRLAAA